MTSVTNAGVRLWETQKAQRTGLCIGLDPHFDLGDKFPDGFYGGFEHKREWVIDLFQAFDKALEFLPGDNNSWTQNGGDNIVRIAGVVNYTIDVIDAAWDCGIRVFKPQWGHFERLPLVGQLVLSILCKHIRGLAKKDRAPYFLILDRKAGDIADSQVPCYDAYLTDVMKPLFGSIPGQFGFDSITTTSWMGEDVLSAGLPHFKNGKGATVVTRTSNASGTMLQDAHILPSAVEVTPQQAVFRYTPEMHVELTKLAGFPPLVHEAMLYATTLFSRNNGLDWQGVSPIFSVMGATRKMSTTFRAIRGDGAIALIPGFGHQGGKFENIDRLRVFRGPLEGHWGIFSSSRAHNYPWMKEYGGEGDPMRLKDEMARAVTSFRKAEKAAYIVNGKSYPF